jgi:hypothetical protein
VKTQQREEGPGPVESAELVIVAAAAAQGLLVGAWLALFPEGALRVGGFPPAPVFFVRFAGVLHVLLAGGYALEYMRFRGVTLLVIGKGVTAFFLATAWVGDGLPWLMVIAVFVEAAFASGAALVHPGASRSRRARARLRLVTPTPSEVRPVGRSGRNGK